jgi:hypothetical protein
VPKLPRAPDSPGQTIAGRYVIEEALGRGGMAAVFRVCEQRSGRRLALKRSWGRTSRAERRRRVFLEREYQTLAQLAHPRIIEVYDYGVDEHGPFYTMELLDGADLDKSGQLPWREACALLRDIASSLAILHSRGLLHRDVSARNVRRTADGRAKLLDFGAMTSVGTPADVVGTPPFMSPEVLQMQALDARADLFSLGALGYYLATGRHAYPARRLSELRDVWRSRPTPPARLVPELPPALSQLLLQLLALDRSARPQSAAEVMERLCAIAQLPVEELGAISRAYLTMPTLVGREKALIAVRRSMLSLVRGDGACVLIEGPEGSGRSRLLDACVLEGKLIGATVARASAAEAEAEEWSVARVLCTQLIEQLPKQASEAGRLSHGVIAHVLDELRVEGNVTLSMSYPERSLMLRELRDFVLALGRGQRVLIAVDDADRIDEPSAALLAALADKAERQSLILALAIERGAEQTHSPSLQVLFSLAQRVELAPLEPEQTEALLHSVFGGASHLQLCATLIHGLAQGNPRDTMELLQQLIDRGLARYEAGSWRLPAQPDDVQLPATLADSLRGRLEQLSPDALELAQALSLSEGDNVAQANYSRLTGHGDQKRVFQAREELIAQRVLLATGEHYNFSQRGFASLLREGLPPARRRQLQTRLAELAAQSGADVLRQAHHLLHAGREKRAIELLCSIDLAACQPPIALLEHAIAWAEKADQPVRVLHQLRMAGLVVAPFLGAIGAFRRWLPPVLERLLQDSGVALYRELAHLPAAERMAQALGQQQQRYLDTPEPLRVLSVSDAIRELGRTCGVTAAIAVSFFDLELLEALPDLEPLLPLSPVFALIQQLIDAGKDWISGRGEASQAKYSDALSKISRPDRGGLDDEYYDRIRLALHYALALLEANHGLDAAEERAKLMEQHRSMRVRAWRVRMLLCLNQGDLEGARKAQRRSELLQLQDGAQAHYPGSSAGFELISCSLAGDLLGVKEAVDALLYLADQHPGWRPMLLLGQSRYRELQGDLPEALAILQQGLACAPPGRHLVFPMLAASEVRVLNALGRREEALQAGDRHIAACERERLTPTDRYLRVEFAQLLAEAGQTERALAMIEPWLQWAEQNGVKGLASGYVYEARARMALAQQDRAGFERFCERCAAEYRKGNNPALLARFARLLEDARPQVQGALELPEPAILLRTQLAETEHNTVHSRLLECLDRSDRARCALTMLLQSCDSFQGYLYGLEGEQLQPLAGLPDLVAEAELVGWLGRWVAAERAVAAEEFGAETVSQRQRSQDGDETESQAHHEVPDEYLDSEGRQFWAVLLVGEIGDQESVAGVFALHVANARQRRPRRELLTEIASQMLERGDVSGAPLG